MFSTAVKSNSILSDTYKNKKLSVHLNSIFFPQDETYAIFNKRIMQYAQSMMSKGFADDKIFFLLCDSKEKHIKMGDGFYYVKEVERIIKLFKRHHRRWYTPLVFLDFDLSYTKKTKQFTEILKINDMFTVRKEDFSDIINSGKKINLLTLHHVLHKTAECEQLLDQLESFYDTECLIIVKEYDCVNSEFAKVLDAEHAFYHYFRDTKKSIDELISSFSNYSANYFSKEHLIEMFVQRGYKHIPYNGLYISDTNNNFYVFHWNKSKKD